MELLYMPSRTHALARHSDAPRFQYGSVENQRMALQARVWEPATRRALQQAGLAAGQSALDVGCGACDVMRLMAEQVGEGGRVTGLDIDAPRAVQALTALQRQGPAVCPNTINIIPPPNKVNNCTL